VPSRTSLPRLRRIEPVLRRALAGDCRVARGSHVLIAVSGGADSTSLLVGLVRIAHERDITLTAAHLHHGLRGEDADRDLEQVRALCERLGVELQSARWDCRARMKRRGLTGQAGLRELRREFLTRAARTAGADLIATAHTADDQAETLLMRLGRGTGLAGLAGITPRSGRWIRPLLHATRAAIEADLTGAGLEWREDPSNADPAYLRNRIRATAVAAVAQALDPDAAPATGRAALAGRISRTLDEVRSARRVLESWADRRLTQVCDARAGGATLAARQTAAYPLALRRALYRRLWRRFAPESRGLTGPHLEAIDRLFGTARGSGRIHLPCGVVAERRSAVVRFQRQGIPRRT
jgi:tRNA(Ile)-lysidine synthase